MVVPVQQHSVITPFPKGSRKDIRQVTASPLSFFFLFVWFGWSLKWAGMQMEDIWQVDICLQS